MNLGINHRSVLLNHRSVSTVAHMSRNPTPSSEQVAAVIDGAITASGLSVNQAATLSRVPRQTLERKLAGIGSFTVPELTRLAPVLGTTASALLAAVEEKAA